MNQKFHFNYIKKMNGHSIFIAIQYQFRNCFGKEKQFPVWDGLENGLKYIFFLSSIKANQSLNVSDDDMAWRNV